MTTATQGAPAYGTGAQDSRWGFCHDNPTRVMKIGKATIWAGRHRDLDPDQNWHLRIRLADDNYFRNDTYVWANAGAQALLPRDIYTVEPPPTLDIEWQDYSVPDLGKDWWVSLTNAIKKISGDVAVYCMGGHGRTGTTLSILAALGGACGKRDPVLWIRKQYCDNCVESTTQISYIEEILGRKIHAQPTSLWSRAGTTYSSYGSSTDTKITKNTSVFNGKNVEPEHIVREYYWEPDPDGGPPTMKPTIQMDDTKPLHKQIVTVVGNAAKLLKP